jgi:hypothetical protein
MRGGICEEKGAPFNPNPNCICRVYRNSVCHIIEQSSILELAVNSRGKSSWLLGAVETIKKRARPSPAITMSLQAGAAGKVARTGRYSNGRAKEHLWKKWAGIQ